MASACSRSSRRYCSGYSSLLIVISSTVLTACGVTGFVIPFSSTRRHNTVPSSSSTRWSPGSTSTFRPTRIGSASSNAKSHDRASRVLQSSSTDTDTDIAETDMSNSKPSSIQSKQYNQTFDLTTALFCGGLAFDAYAEPPANSTRWERGSKGLSIAFLSPSFTRNLYKGLLQITPLQCTDLPDEDSTTESIMTGGGVDAYLLVGVVEGKWEEDLKIIERQQYHNGVRDLQGCAHVGRSSTAWSNVNERQAKANVKQGKGGAYHVKSSWGKGGQAIWADEEPFYLYVQDPADATLVFTVVDDAVVGEGDVVGSAHRKLRDLIPSAARGDPVAAMKEALLARLQSERKGPDQIDNMSGRSLVEAVVQEWEGDVKLTSKPKKKDKGGQTAQAAVVGAMVAGPMGAAVGAAVGQLYEGEIRGKVSARIRYLPIPEINIERPKYSVNGSLPGVSWADLYERHIDDIKQSLPPGSPDPHLEGDDPEFCFFINHDVTGCSCAVYRSLSKRLIAISFRGTTVPKDILTDASIVQDAWVDGEDVSQQTIPKVHAGFRGSLNSISRRLKELVLAAVAPGEDLSQYDIIVTGHSLGGALSTLFTADVAEYGMDAGRALPQLEASEPWWNSLASTFLGGKEEREIRREPPRPKSLRMYNFGSPRVGNDEFVALFESLMADGRIDEAYRIVNGDDLVTRMPRSINLGLGKVDYNHCGPTVLVEPPQFDTEGETNTISPTVLWIEGQSDDGECPVRDGNAITSPLASGALLGDIVSGIKSVTADIPDDEKRDKIGGAFFDISKTGEYMSRMGEIAGTVSGRLQELTVDDLPSLVGIDKKYTAREMKIIQSLFSGQALNHHLEPDYYKAMGMACGYVALVGQELQSVETLLREGVPDSVVDMGMQQQEETENLAEAVAARAVQADDAKLDAEIYDAFARVLKEEKSVSKDRSDV